MDEWLERLVTELDVSAGPGDGYVRLLPLVDALRQQGFVVLLKWDGERDPSAGDNGQFTALISGGALAHTGDFFRRDAHSMDETLTGVLADFASWRGGQSH